MKQTYRQVRLAILIGLTSVLFACATTSVDYAEKILGKWDTEIQGFPVTLDFSETEITVVGMGQSVPYTIAGNVITFEFQGTQVQTIEFQNDDAMTQVNQTTQDVTTYIRTQ